MNSPKGALMPGLALLLICVSTSGVAASIARQAAKLPDIAAPPGGHAEWVARAMRLNGVPMTIKSFTAKSNADEVLHHYERTLRTSADSQTRRTQEGQWQILSVMNEHSYVTVRATNGVDGATGTVTVTPSLEDAQPHKHTRFPHPNSAQLISIQEYEDEGVEAEHLSFVSRRSAAVEGHQFAAVLEQRGWQVLRDEPSGRARTAHVVEAQNASALAFIHLRRADTGGLTTILVVWRKA